MDQRGGKVLPLCLSCKIAFILTIHGPGGEVLRTQWYPRWNGFRTNVIYMDSLHGLIFRNQLMFIMLLMPTGHFFLFGSCPPRWLMVNPLLVMDISRNLEFLRYMLHRISGCHHAFLHNIMCHFRLLFLLCAVPDRTAVYLQCPTVHTADTLKYMECICSVGCKYTSDTLLTTVCTTCTLWGSPLVVACCVSHHLPLVDCHIHCNYTPGF